MAFHHFMPEPGLLRWIASAKPVLLTTVRHPGDVLISLYHHNRSFQTADVNLQELKDMLTQPFARVNIEPPATHPFHRELDISIAWKHTGLSRLVRYEDLRLRTMSTLLALAADIAPVSQERIEQAIERCEIGQMRSLADNHGKFFRSGTVGEWSRVLSPEILSVLAAEPYKSQFQTLGYSLDPSQVSIDPPAQTPRRNPFHATRQFDNGVPVAPVIVDFYLSLDPALNDRWPPISQTGPDSFYEWMNGSAERPETLSVPIFISRLADHIYRGRPDLQQTFPHLSGIDRVRYAHWLLQNAAEYRLHPSLLTAIRKHFIHWGNSQYPGQAPGFDPWPKLTASSMYVYNARPDVRQAFPDLSGIDRVRYLEWFVCNGHQHRMDPALLDQAKDTLVRWGNARSKEDRERRPWWPGLTNYSLYLYRSMPELQVEFKDIFGEDRWNLLEWVIGAQNGLAIFPELTAAISQNLDRLRAFRAFAGRFRRRR